MKAKDLMEKLQELVDQHGNLYVEREDGIVFSNIEFNDDIEGSDPVIVLT